MRGNSNASHFFLWTCPERLCSSAWEYVPTLLKRAAITWVSLAKDQGPTELVFKEPILNNGTVIYSTIWAVHTDHGMCRQEGMARPCFRLGQLLLLSAKSDPLQRLLPSARRAKDQREHIHQNLPKTKGCLRLSLKLLRGKVSLEVKQLVFSLGPSTITANTLSTFLLNCPLLFCSKTLFPHVPWTTSAHPGTLSGSNVLFCFVSNSTLVLLKGHTICIWDVWGCKRKSSLS